MLRQTGLQADTSSMFELALEELRERPCWQKVLAAYRTKQTAAKTAGDERFGMPRIEQVEGVPTEHLSRVHGRLIALGLLQFELLDRTDGVRYRVSPDGLRALSEIEKADPHALPQSA